MKKQLIDYLKVGDKVFDTRFGWGVVKSTNSRQKNFPIVADFQDKHITTNYTNEGKYGEDNVNPSLFLHEIKLKQEIPEEFVEGEIVLANYGCQDTNWFVAKYYKKKDTLHLVYIATLNGFSKTTIDCEVVKSFDKSHFTK